MSEDFELLEEGIITNFIVNKSVSVVLEKALQTSKKDFASFCAFARAAGLESTILKLIKDFFRIKASRLALIENYKLPDIKIESEGEEIFEGFMDTVSSMVNNVTKYFNLIKFYIQLKYLDKTNFIENNKPLIINACIWLLAINGNLVKWVNKIKKSLMSN